MTERDPEIRSYARRVIAGVRDEQNDAVDGSLQDAMALFIAMVESDLMYFRDPSSSYSSASSSGATIDYLQFPRQTLTQTTAGTVMTSRWPSMHSWSRLEDGPLSSPCRATSCRPWPSI